MKIAIVSAMEEEIKYTKEKFSANKIDNLNGQDVMIYEGGKNTFYFLNSGIGKVNASITTTLLITKYAPDLIISIGTSGGVNSNLKIGDIVVGDKLAFHDVDVEAFGYEFGQYPGEKPYLEIDNISYITDLLSNIGLNYHTGTILTGDQFISSKEKSIELENKFSNVYAIEMESSAILMTSNKLDTKCYVIRTISDLAHSESTVEFDQYLDIVSKKFYQIVLAFENE